MWKIIIISEKLKIISIERIGKSLQILMWLNGQFNPWLILSLNQKKYTIFSKGEVPSWPPAFFPSSSWGRQRYYVTSGALSQEIPWESWYDGMVDLNFDHEKCWFYMIWYAKKLGLMTNSAV